MDKLWAPWRVKYITKIIKRNKGCVFCRMLKEKRDKKNYIVTRGKHAHSVLNLYPYNNGHMLVLPNRHVYELSALAKEEREELLDLLDATKALLDKTLKPHGYNIGINLGKAAGPVFPSTCIFTWFPAGEATSILCR